MKSRSYGEQYLRNLVAGVLLGAVAAGLIWIGEELKSHVLCGFSFLVLSLWPAYVVAGALKTGVSNIKSSVVAHDRNPFTYWLFVAMTGVIHLLFLGLGVACFLKKATPTGW